MRWYLRYSLSYRDLVEMLEERGLSLAHTTIMRWVHRYGSDLDKRVRRYLKKTNDSWRVDETYIKVKGKWMYFSISTSMAKLDKSFSSILEFLHQNHLTRIKKQIEACDLLILDELGYVPFQKQGAELLFHIIADCYEQKSVIVTSNLESGQWNRIFGDNRLTSALVDRLVHHAHIIAFTGESYRLRNALSSGNTKIKI
ncbi:ATP-binding protein [Bacillus cereus group sp. N6]|uniref:ATP-binding protein n=1 Tax=Bacillus cereus group sp. N6 TaxID=2794583 RepID=UPI0031F6CA22